MRIALYGRLTQSTDFAILEQFFHYLAQHHVSYAVHTAYAEELAQSPELAPFLHNTFSKPEQVRNYDFMYSLGGDGTMLDALRFTCKHQIPVLGVNLGRLGFLASGQQSDLVDLTARLLQNNWRLEYRNMIEIEASPTQIFAANNFGLNEATIHKANSNEMIVIHAYINGEFLNTFWTDGLIISTPTGSTAYSLACGGPIIMPQAGVFVLTPIAPHSLTVRPFIIPDNAVVSFEIESRSGQALIAVDSRTELVESHVEIAIRKSQLKARLVRVNSPTYFATLRERLNWGMDIRN
jgi:NAD+ kinase